MSPAGLICLVEEDEAGEDELGNEEGGRENMVEMVAVVVVGKGKCVVGMTMVAVREVDRFVKDAALVENGRGVGSAVTTGVLDDVDNPGVFSRGHAFGNPQGSIEQQPIKLLTEQA
jgi:hypothetical protein